MFDILFNLFLVIAGLVALLWSADKFISGAAETARYLGMSPLMVGMIIIGFGTSAPEMLVSAFAAFDGNPGLALGNAYGSNIANIGLVLGFTALFYPLTVSKQIVHRELPILIVVLLVCLYFLYDGILTRPESIIMLVLIVAILVAGSLKDVDDEHGNAELDKTHINLKKSLLWLVIGLVILLVSSKYLVQGAVVIAEIIGVSDLVIGLTIIAIGTSLPELASSIVSAKKGESEMVLGNIIGSCLFNSLAVVGIGGAIKSIQVSDIFLKRDFLVGFFLTILLFGFAIYASKQRSINKPHGITFLLCYAGFSVYLLLTLKS